MSALTSLARREPVAANTAKASALEDDAAVVAAAAPLGRADGAAAAPDVATAVLGAMASERLEEPRRRTRNSGLAEKWLGE